MTASLWRTLALASVSFLAMGTLAHADTAPAAPKPDAADEAPAAEDPHEVVVYARKRAEN